MSDPAKMTLTFGSLFSGIGGFDLGFERAGMRCAWQCEIDAPARSILRRHFRGPRLYDDVTKLSRPTGVDVLCGGFPCQDLSVAGRRAGLAGKRSGLWHEFRRLAGELAPRVVVIENVPGLLSSHSGRDFAVLLHGLGKLGYRLAWRVLNSEYDRVVQRRRRLFVVGSLGDGRCAEILFEPESLRWHPSPRRETGQDVALPLTCRVDRGGEHREAHGNNLVAGTLSTDVMPTMLNGANTPAGHNARSGDSKDAYIVPHSAGVRRLTPREAERLQAFPDDWTRWCHDDREQKDGPRYKQLGNAVTVNVAAWIGQRIVEATRESR